MQPGTAFFHTSTGAVAILLDTNQWLYAWVTGYSFVPNDSPTRFTGPEWLRLASNAEYFTFPWGPASRKMESASANIPPEAAEALQRAFGEGI